MHNSTKKKHQVYESACFQTVSESAEQMVPEGSQHEGKFLFILAAVSFTKVVQTKVPLVCRRASRWLLHCAAWGRQSNERDENEFWTHFGQIAE